MSSPDDSCLAWYLVFRNGGDMNYLEWEPASLYMSLATKEATIGLKEGREYLGIATNRLNAYIDNPANHALNTMHPTFILISGEVIACRQVFKEAQKHSSML